MEILKGYCAKVRGQQKWQDCRTGCPGEPPFSRHLKTPRGNEGQRCFPGTAPLNQKFYHDGS